MTLELLQEASVQEKIDISVRILDEDLHRMQILARITDVEPDQFGVFVARALRTYAHLLEDVTNDQRHLFLGSINAYGNPVPDFEIFLPGLGDVPTLVQDMQTPTQPGTFQTLAVSLKPEDHDRMKALAQRTNLQTEQFYIFIARALNLYCNLVEQVIQLKKRVFVGTLNQLNQAVPEEELVIPGTERYL